MSNDSQDISGDGRDTVHNIETVLLVYCGTGGVITSINGPDLGVVVSLQSDTHSFPKLDDPKRPFVDLENGLTWIHPLTDVHGSGRHETPRPTLCLDGTGTDTVLSPRVFGNEKDVLVPDGSGRDEWGLGSLLSSVGVPHCPVTRTSTHNCSGFTTSGNRVHVR